MPKFVTRGLFTAFVLLSLFAASSALGARSSRSAKADAVHSRAGSGRRAGGPTRGGQTRRVGKGARRVSQGHKVGPVHHKQGGTSTPPVIPAPPLEPVSPVEPAPPILPAPPTASFTYSPTSPTVGHAVEFDGTGSSCPDEPCTYAWSDDGGSVRPMPALWPLGGGAVISFTFLESGTKYVRLVVTDASRRTATVEQNMAVTAESPPPPPPPPAPEPEPEPEPVSPPTNTAMPAISGTAIEGQRLSATNGGWSGNPTSYSYQWRHCNSSGRSCANIGSATSSSYTLAASDVGHTMRVMVTAANEGGSSSMSSPTTAMVTAPAPTPPESTPPENPTPPEAPSSPETGGGEGCTTTISSGLQTAIANAASGATICLNAGSYGELTLSTAKTSQVTIMPAAGVAGSSVKLGYVDVGTSSGLTFKGLSVAGGIVGVSGGKPGTHISFVGDTFTGALCINVPTNQAVDVLVEGSSFNGLGQSCTEGRIGVSGDNVNHTVGDGIVIAHNSIGNGGASDGVNINGGAYGTQIGPDNEFTHIIQSGCGAVHCDPIQFYGAIDTTITGNYFREDSSQIESPDGNGSPMTVTNNVFVQYANPIQIGGGEGDVFNHNTIVGDLEIGHENVGASTGETITNNVITNGISLNGGQSESGWKVEYNLIPGGGGGTHGLSGNPSFVGGANPATWAGYALTSSSQGHLAASDGTDIGSNHFGE